MADNPLFFMERMVVIILHDQICSSQVYKFMLPNVMCTWLLVKNNCRNFIYMIYCIAAWRNYSTALVNVVELYSVCV